MVENFQSVVWVSYFAIVYLMVIRSYRRMDTTLSIFFSDNKMAGR
jgi:hypothetical protein